MLSNETHHRAVKVSFFDEKGQEIVVQQRSVDKTALNRTLTVTDDDISRLKGEFDKKSAANAQELQKTVRVWLSTRTCGG